MPIEGGLYRLRGVPLNSHSKKLQIPGSIPPPHPPHSFPSSLPPMVEIEEEEAAVSDAQIHATLHITVSPDGVSERKENTSQNEVKVA